MSHTPGPWRCYIDDDGGGTFAVAIEKHDGSWPLPLSVENAALIAAAPDLLAALRGLVELSSFVDALYALSVHDPEEAQRKQRMANALTAIAKAEGR